MSHVTYEWVMSHMKESCHIWMRHVTYEWFTWLKKTYKGSACCAHFRWGLFCKRALQKRRYSAKETYNFIPHIWMIHMIKEHMRRKCMLGTHTHIWVGWNTNEFVMPHVWMSRIKQDNVQEQLPAVHTHTPTNSNENTLSLRHETVKF